MVRDTGTRFLLWVLANRTDASGEYNEAEVLDIPDGPMPDPVTASHLPAMLMQQQGNRPLGFILVDAALIPPGRAEVIGNVPRPTDRPTPAKFIIDARELDDWLRSFLPGGDHILYRRRAD